MERRQFVKGAAAAIGAMAYGARSIPATAQESTPADAAPVKTNRHVRAVSIGFDWHVPVLAAVDTR
ncbi:MAG: twin-arginine translocation signal domain-containing protein, partial [Candidatus Acidiferrales bacterium]